MKTVVPTPMLRQVLYADAVVSAAMGLLMVLEAHALADWLAIPAAWLRAAGVVLLPYAAIVGIVASRPLVPRTVVMAIVLCNALWAIDCGLLLAGGWLRPTPLGSGFVLMQAAGVLLFAVLQWLGLRRSGTVAA